MSSNNPEFMRELAEQIHAEAAAREAQQADAERANAEQLALEEARAQQIREAAENSARIKAAEQQEAQSRAEKIFAVIPTIASAAIKKAPTPDFVYKVPERKPEIVYVTRRNLLGISRTVRTETKPLRGPEPLELWKFGSGQDNAHLGSVMIYTPGGFDNEDYWTRKSGGATGYTKPTSSPFYIQGWKGLVVSSVGNLYQYSDVPEKYISEIDSKPKLLNTDYFNTMQRTDLLQRELVSFVVTNGLQNLL